MMKRDIKSDLEGGRISRGTKQAIGERADFPVKEREKKSLKERTIKELGMTRKEVALSIWGKERGNRMPGYLSHPDRGV